MREVCLGVQAEVEAIVEVPEKGGVEGILHCYFTAWAVGQLVLNMLGA